MSTRERERERTRDRERARTRPPPAREAEQPATRESARQQTQSRTAQAQRTQLKAQTATATAGRAGERHITVEWVPIWIGNDCSAWFAVATLAGNGLEVTIEQLQYRRVYGGTSLLQTQPIPVAPIGTTFKLTIRDTTSGETLEQSGYWYRIGGGSLFSKLWTWVKQQLGKAAKGP